MSCTHEGWIFTKTRKFAAGGRLQIGQIIAKPFEPEQCLLPGGPLPVPDYVVRDITEETQASVKTDSALKVMFDIWADTAVIPLEGKAGARIERSNQLSWVFDSLQSTQVSLPYEYVEESMQYGEVSRHLKEWHLRNWEWNRRIFIVTGVTIAKGASMVKTGSSSAGAHTTATANLTSASIQATAGEKISMESNQATVEKVGSATDFVFQYSINEVFYSEKRQKSYRKGPGEVSSVGHKYTVDSCEDPPDASEIEAFILDGVGDNAYIGEDEPDLRTFQVSEGQHSSRKYVCLVPSDENGLHFVGKVDEMVNG